MTDVPEPTTSTDPRNNVEVRTAQSEQGRAVARAGGSALPPEQLDARDAEGPSGTAAGDPLAGVLISEEDAEEAVSGDTGPLSSGTQPTGTLDRPV